MPLYRETEDFSIFSVMSDDSLTIENQLVASQVEMDLRRIINELPDRSKRSGNDAYVPRYEFQGNLRGDRG